MMRRMMIMATCFLAVATAQGPTRIYSYYMLPGGTAWIWKSIVIDPPLSITLDSTGQAHVVMPAASWETFRTNGGTYTLSRTPLTPPDVFLNGVLQSEGDDYTVAGRVVTFTSEISSPAIIRIRYQ